MDRSAKLVIQLRKQAQELASREKIMLSMLEDLQVTKEQLEEQKKSLQAANEKLEAMGKLKDEFVATVNHELRTPLTAIKEGVSLVRDEVLGSVNAEQREFLTMVDESVSRLAGLINNLLDIAKIESGRISLMRRRVKVGDLIKNTSLNYKPICGKRTVKAELASVPDVFCDPDRILQVLGNLFSNAVKFTKDDGTIAFLIEERNGFIVISVQDDGIGIAKDDLSKLFQKFSQVCADQNRPHGTGLGLALCKQLIELHKGSISADSSPSGSKFTFTLPVYRSDFALEEYFIDQREIAERDSGGHVSIVVIDGKDMIKNISSNQSQGEASSGNSESVLELIRKHLHSTDTVFTREPRWIVIVAATDDKGTESIVKRLQEMLQELPREIEGQVCPITVNLGTAVYPRDGVDVHRLFDRATASLHQISITESKGGLP